MPILVWKEVRSLAPVWLASAVLVVAGALDERLHGAGVAAFVLGAIALGALSMGHEYSDRTLSLLLAQPARRERLLVLKFGVLAVMLLALTALAGTGILSADAAAAAWPERSTAWRSLGLGVALVGGLFLAPWLSMVCRSALAGIVFAAAVPAALWIGSEVMSTDLLVAVPAAQSGSGAQTFRIFWPMLLVAAAVAAVSTWRKFVRLEAVDGLAFEVRPPAWRFLQTVRKTSAATPADRGRWRRLIAKELHLQQITFAVSGLYLAFCAVLALAPQTEYGADLLTVLTLAYAGAIPLLAGSLASAGERQLGTLGWQVLLPVAARQQWALKVAVVMVVSLALAIGLPFALHEELNLWFDPSASPYQALAYAFGLVIMTATVSLYVSSLSTNTVVALLVSLPIAFAVGIALGEPLADLRWDLERLFYSPAQWPYVGPDTPLTVLLALLGLGALALLLRFGMLNHRSAERGMPQVCRQVGWMAGAAAAAWISAASGMVAMSYAQKRLYEWSVAKVVFEVAGRDTAGNSDVFVLVLFNPESERFGSWWVFANDSGRFEKELFPPGHPLAPRWWPPGPVAAIAISRDSSSYRELRRDLVGERGSSTALLETLRLEAIPLTLKSGTTTTVRLDLLQLP